MSSFISNILHSINYMVCNYIYFQNLNLKTVNNLSEVLQDIAEKNLKYNFCLKSFSRKLFFYENLLKCLFLILILKGKKRKKYLFNVN